MLPKKASISSAKRRRKNLSPPKKKDFGKFWEMNLLGTSSAKSLLYTVYFYNGKIFGLRGGDHRNIVR